jgi:hypothetical protein
MPFFHNLQKLAEASTEEKIEITLYRRHFVVVWVIYVVLITQNM